MCRNPRKGDTIEFRDSQGWQRGIIQAGPEGHAFLVKHGNLCMWIDVDRVFLVTPDATEDTTT